VPVPSHLNPLIIGAGPAGLTAALRLTSNGVTPRVYEATEHVGGLARTPHDGGWRIDPGGHRFFTRDEEVLDLWKSLLPADQWISVRRRSAMLVNGHYVRYPLVGRDLLTQMGYRHGLHGLTSLLWSRISRLKGRIDDSASFREWGTAEFGNHWYRLFFDGYVRKTWLAEPDEITSDWARQRIKPISWRAREARDAVDHDVFRYPRQGPGQVWEAATAALAELGVRPALGAQVDRVRFDGGGWTIELQNGETASGDAVFSSMPLRLLVESLDPKPPSHIRTAAAALRHRALITVAVAIRRPYDIPFNWVYTPGGDFQAGRIQNYSRWSSGLSPTDWEGTYLGFEYYIAPDGEMWTAGDEHLRRLVEADVRALGMDSSLIERVTVLRSRFAYPISDPVRDRSVAHVRDYLRQTHPSLHPIGRNGMHRYDNQDHAMLSAIHSVARYFGADVDPWQVNTDRGYHEFGVLRA
jgi:UDP-galactopyranose mutase